MVIEMVMNDNNDGCASTMTIESKWEYFSDEATDQTLPLPL